MKKNSLFEPQRQSIFAIILILLKLIRVLVRQVWPIALILVVNRGDNLRLWLVLIVAAIGIFSLIGSVISYLKFTYFIKDDQLHITKGLLRRTNTDLPFERIQTVDFEQNVIHQIFNVVRVNVDSAGSKGSEVSFDALDMEQARALRDFILAQKASQKTTEITDEIRHEKAEELILHLSPGDLVKIGISQNHLRTAAIIFGAMWALLDNINQAFDTDIVELASNQAEMLVTGSIILVLIAIPVFLIISFLYTLVRTVLRYYDLRFTKTESGFKLVSGLLTKKEKSAQKNKIQIIAWSTNPVRKLFKMYNLNLYQASSIDVIGGKAISVPGCYKPHVDKTLESVFPGVSDVVYETHGIHPLARFRFILFAGLFPCLVFTVVALVTNNYSLFWAWLYFPLSVVMGQLYYKKRKLQLHKDFLIASGGIFGTKHKILEIYKMQSVKLNQSFYQWRKDLATVTMYTAAGDVRIPFIPIDKAREIRDYLLWRIESDGRGWM
jgi:putative membrane protein